MTLFLQRDTKVFLEKKVGSVSQYWEIPVLEGFSFTQGNETTETTLSEMADANGLTRRGRRVFNDALSPAEWSMSTYIRPFISAGTGSGAADNALNHHLIEEVLWANFVGKGEWSTATTALIPGDTLAITVNGTSGGTDGTYEIDAFEYTSDGSGINATFLVTVSSGVVSEIKVVNPGTGFASGDVIIFPADLFGTAANVTSTLVAGDIDSSQTTAYDYELDNVLFGTGSSTIYFGGSNVAELGTFNLYFVLGAQTATAANNYTAAEILSGKLKVYKVANCVVNEATISFDVDGIAQIDWSGNGTEIIAFDGSTTSDPVHGDISQLNMSGASVIREDITATDNFIRNKVSALTVTAGAPGTFDGAGLGVYNFTLTSGSITFSNNVTYLTPETLGIVNTPIGHITGNKSVSGDFTCYISAGTAGDSADFYADMVSAAAKAIITNEFALGFKLGGVAGTPRFEVNLPTAHIEIPEVNIEDVIAVNMNFHGLPSTITDNDEANLVIVGA